MVGATGRTSRSAGWRAFSSRAAFSIGGQMQRISCARDPGKSASTPAGALAGADAPPRSASPSGFPT